MPKRNFDPCSHVGETHGIYTIIDALDEKDQYGRYIYIGKCSECGYERRACYGHFNAEPTKVCMHSRLGTDKFVPMTKWNNKRIENIYNKIKQRCYEENNKDYKWYGGKGIKICDEWLNDPKLFEEWSLQNGYTDELTIDRINEDKNYSPDNCRWIPRIYNSKYKSTTSIIEVDGEVHTGKDWSKILGFGVNRINTYIRQYGLDNVIEFIRRYVANPNLKPFNKNQSIYSVYMN